MDSNVIFVDMPASIKSYTVCNPDSTYTIVLNSKHSHEQQLASYFHELQHIQNDDFFDIKTDVNIVEILAHCQ